MCGGDCGGENGRGGQRGGLGNWGGGGDNCRVVLQFCLPSFLNVEAA